MNTRTALAVLTAGCAVTLVAPDIAGATSGGATASNASAARFVPGASSGFFSGSGGTSGSHGSTGSAPSTSAGADVSYPQCGRTLPKGQAFGIVGLNGGLANSLNSCLGGSGSSPSQSELYWAVATSSGTTTQPKASLYVNTGDPGDLYNSTVIADWPTSGSTPYGTCQTTSVSTASGSVTVGQNSPASAWQYGFNRASQDESWLAQAAIGLNASQSKVTVPSSPGAYSFWLDVETANTWQSGTTGRQMNAADLQGMVAALQGAGVSRIGVYSTSSQWTQVTGAGGALGALSALPVWLPGASSLAGARAACPASSFTSGVVSLTQWVSGGVDQDWSCAG